MNPGYLLDQHPGAIHVEVPIAPPLPDHIREQFEEMPCCMGVAARGVEYCTCWRPTYDVEQSAELALLAPVRVRGSCCADCAYKPDSPERSGEEAGWLLGLPAAPDRLFVCHQGIRRVTTWEHSLAPGIIVPAGPGDYRPPITNGRAFRADGIPAQICAGFAARAGRTLAVRLEALTRLSC